MVEENHVHPPFQSSSQCPTILPPNQQDLLRRIVTNIESNAWPDEIYVLWGLDRTIINWEGSEWIDDRSFTRSRILALENAGFIQTRSVSEHRINLSLTRKGYEAVHSNFTDPDTTLPPNFEPTLVNFWRFCDWQHRLGLLVIIGTIFMTGYGAAQVEILKRAIDLVKDIIGLF